MGNHEAAMPDEGQVLVRVTRDTIEILSPARNPQDCRRTERRRCPTRGGTTCTARAGHSGVVVAIATFLDYSQITLAAMPCEWRAGVVNVCTVAGLAAVVWRHDALLIGIVGGLLVSGILFVRTGAYREYLAAIEEMHGVPPLGAILRYNVVNLVQRSEPYGGADPFPGEMAYALIVGCWC